MRAGWPAGPWSWRRTGSPSVVLLECAEPRVEQGVDGVANFGEAGADGLAVEVAVVDAFEDRGELVRREAEVEAEPRQVAVAAGRVAGDDLLLAEEARSRARVGHGSAPQDVAEPVVDQHQPEVGERVAERGHLPVEDGRRLVVGVDQHVVQAVVAVHDAGGRLRRHVGGEAGVQLLRGGEVTAVRRVELLLPPGDLTGEVALRAAEVGQADARRLDRVQGGQGVDQPLRDRPGPLRPERGELRGPAVRRTRHPLHHVERRTEHGVVPAQRVRRGHGHVGVLERRHDAVLAHHVVRGREHVPQRWASDDPGLLPVAHLVGQVGLPARDETRGGLAPDAGHRRTEPGREAVQVEARELLLSLHQGTTTLTVSTAHTGLSPPSRSRVTLALTWWPPAPGVTERSSTPARTWASTGTGAGKRSLSAP